jgi:hypothetical protein
MTPRLTKGHPAGWPVYLDFGAVDWPDPWAEAVISYVWGLTANAGVNVAITTVLPKLRRREYTRVLFRPERVIPGDTAAGTTECEAYRCGDIRFGSEVTVGTTGFDRTDATVAAHEVIHCVSSPAHPDFPGVHEPGARSLMDTPADFMGALSRGRVKHCNAVIADLLAGWRADYRHHADGVVRFERFNIKTPNA